MRRKHRGDIYILLETGRFWTIELLIKWARDRVLNLQACQHYCVSAKAWERANTKLCWTHLTCLSGRQCAGIQRYTMCFVHVRKESKCITCDWVIRNKQFRRST